MVRAVQSSGPLRYAIVDGINVRDSRVHNYPALERRTQPRPAGNPTAKFVERASFGAPLIGVVSQ
jgi:hypothetical protein